MRLWRAKSEKVQLFIGRIYNTDISTSGGNVNLLAGWDQIANAAGVNPGAVDINGATINSGSGNITITGRGSATLTDPWNSGQNGVLIRNSAVVQATTGNVTVTGTGVGAWGMGVDVEGSKVTSADGDVRITGTSGYCSSCYALVSGVIVNRNVSTASEISVTGSGGLLIDGTASDATWSFGVNVGSGGSIRHTGTPATGNMFDVVGHGGHAGHMSYGVSMGGNGYLSTHNAPLTVNGTAGIADGYDSFGVGAANQNVAYFISTGSGTITLVGTPGSSAGSRRYGIAFGGNSYNGEEPGYIQTAGAAVNLFSDSVYIRNTTTYGALIRGAASSSTQPRSAYVPPAQGPVLTPAQTLLVQQHQNDSVFQLLTAIADGVFSNSNTDPVWVGLYQNGSATAVQVAANTQRNIYDAYTSADIFALIRSGQLVNDSNDTTWHSIYRNGQATAAQVDANAFANTYDQYKGMTGNALFAGIVAGDLNPSPSAANAVVWDALKNQNLSGTNKAAQMAGVYDTYKNANATTLLAGLKKDPPDLVYGDTVWNALVAVNATNLAAAYNTYANPVPTSTLTAAQQQLVDAHKNDSTFQLLTAIANGLFTNSDTDPVWVGLFQNGSATAVQVEANRVRNIYDAYTSADIFALIRSGQLVNDSNDTTWHSIYRNGQATAAQVDANAFANTYSQYQGRTANALFAGIVAGDLNPSPSAANAVVWDALKNQNLSGTNRAAQMAGIYDTYKNADTLTLVSGLTHKDFAYGDAIWNALATNGRRDEAYQLFTQVTTNACTSAVTCGTPTPSIDPTHNDDDGTVVIENTHKNQPVPDPNNRTESNDHNVQIILINNQKIMNELRSHPPKGFDAYLLDVTETLMKGGTNVPLSSLVSLMNALGEAGDIDSQLQIVLKGLNLSLEGQETLGDFIARRLSESMQDYKNNGVEFKQAKQFATKYRDIIGDERLRNYVEKVDGSVFNNNDFSKQTTLFEHELDNIIESGNVKLQSGQRLQKLGKVAAGAGLALKFVGKVGDVVQIGSAGIAFINNPDLNNQEKLIGAMAGLNMFVAAGQLGVAIAEWKEGITFNELKALEMDTVVKKIGLMNSAALVVSSLLEQGRNDEAVNEINYMKRIREDIINYTTQLQDETLGKEWIAATFSGNVNKASQFVADLKQIKKTLDSQKFDLAIGSLIYASMAKSAEKNNGSPSYPL